MLVKLEKVVSNKECFSEIFKSPGVLDANVSLKVTRRLTNRCSFVSSFGSTRTRCMSAARVTVPSSVSWVWYSSRASVYRCVQMVRKSKSTLFKKNLLMQFFRGRIESKSRKILERKKVFSKSCT